MDQTTTESELKSWITKPEGENLEFKKAEYQFDEREVYKYCSALANEGGGKLILGIDDKTRAVIGTRSFIGTSDTLPNKILNELGIRVYIEEMIIDNHRILIFHIPSQNPGNPISYRGAYYMRSGSSLTIADSATLKRWLNASIVDFSATIIENLDLKDIDEDALAIFRERWAEHQRNPSYLILPPQKILSANHLIDEQGHLTYAALILFGKPEKLRQILPGAEIFYEWRFLPTIKHDARITWFKPFFSIFDDIWKEINNRNIRFPYQEGFIQKEILAFTEKPIREAVLNAVAHRDYAIKAASIFIKASPKAFTIDSPGGFLPGISPNTILSRNIRHNPRNKLICEIFERAGLVERSGQGLEEIFKTTVEEGKGIPNFEGSDSYHVLMEIPATVTDINFVKFLQKIANEQQTKFSTEEIIDLEKIKNGELINSKEALKKFVRLGVVEKIGRTRGSSSILSHHYYQYEQKPGIYTRISGLSRDEKKFLILKHIEKNKKGYYQDFIEAFPQLNRQDISNLLQELKRQGRIISRGTSKKGYWELLN